MLILSRKENEVVLIGQSIKVMVTKIEGDKVKLGIDAPFNLSIMREELLNREEEDRETKIRQAEKFPKAPNIDYLTGPKDNNDSGGE